MFGGWSEFALAIVFFLVTHAVPSQPKVSVAIVAALGRAGYIIIYSAVSIVALGWLIVAARRAPFVPLLDFSMWRAATPFVVMLPACALVAFAIGQPNPYSFGGLRNERYDPAHPGVVRFTRHPYLAAIALWSLGHALANPDLAHLVLFGCFFAMAFAGMAMPDRRRRSGLSTQRQAYEPQGAGPVGSLTGIGITARAFGAVMLYAALISLHPLFAGAPIRQYLELIDR